MNSVKNYYFLRNSKSTCRNVFGIINGDKIPKVLAIRKCIEWNKPRGINYLSEWGRK